MIKKRIFAVCMVLILALGLYIGTNERFAIRLGNVQTQLPDSLDEMPPVKEKTKVKINDLTKAFDMILKQSDVDFFEGYPIEMSFLHWIRQTYGENVIMDLAYRLYEGYQDNGLWYLETGNSMHVLWISYCKDLNYATYYLDNVKWLSQKNERTLTIDFTGDINLADDWCTMQAVNERENGIYDCFSDEIIKELQGADLSVINNEFVFSDRGNPLAGKELTFRAKSSNVGYLDVLGADLANLANNHMYDYEAVGVTDTIAILNAHGIQTMGAGADISEASLIHYYVANGKKIAIVAATEIERYSNYTKEATEDSAGVLKCLDATRYCKMIEHAKANSDYVIANVHWGTEGIYQYSGREYNLAEKLVNAGADLIIGGHPHRMQGLEYINGVPCLFSMGNFWFSTGTLYTTIAQVQIDTKGHMSLRLLPCIQKDLTTSMLDEEQAVEFYRFVADHSTHILIDKDGFVYNTKDEVGPLPENGYLSGSNYGTYNSNLDLEGRPISIVGNLK